MLAFYIRIPYISTTPWKHVGDTTFLASNLLDSYGVVNVYLDNVMQAASAVVSTQIDCVVEWCLADNAELSLPTKDRTYLPVQFTSLTGATKALLQSGYAADGIMKSRTSMQTDTRDVQNITGRDYYLSPQVNDFTVGETIKSLRCLAKSFDWVFSTTSKSVSFANHVRFLIMQKTSGILKPLDPIHTPCGKDSIGALFAFRAGGLRIKAVDGASKFFTTTTQCCDAISSQTIYFNETATVNQASLGQIDNQAVRGSGEFYFPFYSRTYNLVNNAVPDGYQTADYYAFFARPVHYATITRSDTSTRMYLAEAGSDDISFGFLLGVPDCIRKDTYSINPTWINPLPVA